MSRKMRQVRKEAARVCMSLYLGPLFLLITFGQQRFVIELKVARDARTLPQGLAQTAEYMRTAGVQEGHLVIFDRSETKSWDEKIYQCVEVVGELMVHVWGM